MDDQVYRLDHRNRPYLCAGRSRVVCAVNGRVCEVPRTLDNIQLAEFFFDRLPGRLRRLALRKAIESAASDCVMASPPAADKASTPRVIREYFSLYDTSFSQFKIEHRRVCDFMRQNNILATVNCPEHMVRLYQFPDIFEDRLYQMFKVEESKKVVAMMLSVFPKVPCPRSKNQLAGAIGERCIQWELSTILHGLDNNEFYQQAIGANSDRALSMLLKGVCAPAKHFFMRSVSVLKQYERTVWQDRRYIHKAINQHDFAVRLKKRRAKAERRHFGAAGLAPLQEEIVLRLRSFIDSRQCIDLATGDLIIPAALSDRAVSCLGSYAAALLRHYQRLSDFRGQQDGACIGHVEPLMDICRVFLQIMKLTDTEF